MCDELRCGLSGAMGFEAWSSRLQIQHASTRPLCHVIFVFDFRIMALHTNLIKRHEKELQLNAEQAETITTLTVFNFI